MYQLTYTLTTLSPVIIAKNSGDPNMIGTEDFITGSSMLGALADLYIKKHSLGKDAHLNEHFCKWFLQSGLIFTNAYICPDKETKEHYIPTPLSVQRPKGDVVTNTCYDLLHEVPEGKTSYLGGFCIISDGSISTAEVNKTINFHHERDYEKGSTKEGIIFNYEAISEGQTFRGMILSMDKTSLQGVRELTGKSAVFHIGKSRQTQYGKVLVDFEDVQEFRQDDEEIDPDECSLTFTSPAILLNDYDFCSPDIDTLKKALGEGVEILKAFIKSDTSEGFSSVWGLKKPSQNCIAGGSCLLLKLTNEALKRLKSLQFSGIGHRTNEGFGRFTLNLQSSSKLSIYTPQAELKKPSNPMPPEVKAICTSLIKEYLLKKIASEAMSDAKAFCKNPKPSKSLIGRLEGMVSKTGQINLNLRPLALNQLENCNDGSNTLKEYIETFDIVNKFKHLQLPDSLLTQISYDPLSDEVTKNELYREYWLRFFASMRKELKAKKGGDAQ